MSSAALDFDSLRAPGQLAIVRVREKAEETLGANGADRSSNIEGKIARAVASELGNQRVSNSISALSKS